MPVIAPDHLVIVLANLSAVHPPLPRDGLYRGGDWSLLQSVVHPRFAHAYRRSELLVTDVVCW